MKKILLTITIFIFPFSLFAQEVQLAHYLNFDGQLLDASNNPITSTTPVIFEIYDGSSGNCLLYRETQNVTPDAYGDFSTKIGPDAGHTQHSTVDGDVPWTNIFKNSGSLRPPSSVNCTSGYTPAAGHGRKLRVTVNGAILTPDYTIAPVPMASVAETLQGKRASDFLDSTPASGTSVLDGDFRINNNLSLQLTNTGNTNFVSIRAPSSLASSYNLLLPMDDGDSGQILSTDGNGALSWINPSGGGAITSVFGRLGAVVSSPGDYAASQITNTPAGGIAATNVQDAINELDAEKLSAAGGTMSGALSLQSTLNMNYYTIHNLQDPVNSQDAANKVYVDGTIATYAPGGLSCSNLQTLRWNGSTWVCHTPPAGLPTASVVGQLLKADASLTNQVWSDAVSRGNTAMNPTYTFATASMTGIFPDGSSLGFSVDGSERMRIDSANGYVGIGTIAPSAPLDVNGEIRASAVNIGDFLRIQPSTLPTCDSGSANQVRLQTSTRKICICDGISQWLETNGSTPCTP